MATGDTNVEGGFAAEHGLPTVLDALRPLFAEDEIYIMTGLATDGTLIVNTKSAFFYTLYMEAEESYLFDGGVAGSLEDVIAFTKLISDALEQAEIDHDLHVTDGPMNYVASFPESSFPDGPISNPQA